jgi:hypothetical protein
VPKADEDDDTDDGNDGKKKKTTTPLNYIARTKGDSSGLPFYLSVGQSVLRDLRRTARNMHQVIVQQ